MEFLKFEITEYNDFKEDRTIKLNPDTGILYVRIGKLDLEIKQTEDGLGVIVQALDSELLEQELGSMQIWFDDIQELDKDEDEIYPMH
jgi:hypothetical protein